MKLTKRMLLLVCCVLLLASILVACGGMEDDLVGKWYSAGRDEPKFILYGDGTCEIDGEYGSGKWVLMDDNMLKITNFYGEVEMTATVISVDDDCLVFSIREGKEGTLYSKPTEKE